MTNELEKQFFRCFGIEPKYYCDNDYVFEAMLEDECTDGNMEKCKTCKKVGKTYPQITDRILLELLVIMTRYTDIIDGFDNVQELKEFVLKDLMYSLTQPECNIVKQQVRTLFEEG